MNKEYAIGAASLSDYFITPQEDVSDEYITGELESVRTRLRVMDQLFRGNRPALNLEGKEVIIVDDGIATGNTLLATVKLVRKSNPSKVIIAVPVTSETAAEKLRSEVDDFISVLTPYYFSGVGAFYDDFRQVSDEEVLNYLGKK